mgnify:FL=1
MISQEAKKKENTYKFKTCNLKTFKKNISEFKEDKFANTFISKANLQNQWKYCVGLYDEDELMGAIITTFSINEPKIANLQLLHTFYKHRKKGVGKKLCQFSLNQAIKNKCWYYRVSSEQLYVKFYEKIGFKMLGEQKSKCQLSMFRISCNTFSDCIYDINDPIIKKALYRKGKGGCVTIF